MTFDPDHGTASIPARSWWRRGWDRAKTFRVTGGAAASAPRTSSRVFRWGWRILLVVVLLYYPVGGWIVQNIDDDPQFAPQSVSAGESHSVAMVAAIVDREVNVHSWTPMQPFFLPGGVLDNMPNFQRGMMTAVGRFATELMDQVGRTRGSSQIDRDLEQARGFLNEQPNVWIWQPSVSLWPSATSAQKYRAGRQKLLDYNKRLAAGQAVFDRRSDNLQALLDRIANDSGSDSAVLDQHIVERAGDPFDATCDDIFYFNKGRLYANYLLLRELGTDFQNVIRDRDLARPWAKMVETFRLASELNPFIVWNGYPDGMMLPNHLAAQGFYLLRARTQLLEITNILQK
jgi:predicted secreted protein